MGGRLWKIGGDVFDLSRHGMIMGVLNVTPDSFSDGGQFFDLEKAVAHGMQMAAEGAQIIDVGGESTRPGAEAVDVKEELRRVVPVIEELGLRINAQPPKAFGAVLQSGERSTQSGRDECRRFISIDTSKSEVADAALQAGASIVNDVTGGRGDKRMMELVASRGAAFVIMHMQGTPRTMQKAPHYADVISEVADFFRQQCARALRVRC